MMFHSFYVAYKHAVFREYQDRCEACGRQTDAVAHARQAFLKNYGCKSLQKALTVCQVLVPL